MPGGYCGKILRVNLTKGEIREQTLDENLLRHYIGGTGLAVRILYDETDSSTDPLGPKNVLVFAVGPFAGTKVPLSNRFAAAARSPLTGLWGESDCGGRWGGELKKAGYDALVITGRAEKPVYLWVEDGSAELRDAQELWGLDTYELELEGEVAAIGPAGENLVRYAAIMSGRLNGRAAGRGGMGAVMGSKLLKAVAVRGSGEIPLHDEEGLNAALKGVGKSIRENAIGMHEHGTAGGLITFEKFGGLAIKNWQKGAWQEGAEALTGATMTETILTGRYACGGCTLACGRVVKVEGGPYAMPESAGPEYETIGAFGTMCMIDNLKAVAKMNELCNRYGLDTIETGCVLAFVMEARERGLLKEGPAWGDAQGAIELIHKIAKREGELARLLGEGLRPASEELGKLAPEFAIHTKGMALPMHDPRAYYSASLGYAISSRGACHLQAFSHVFERGALNMPELGYKEIPGRFDPTGKGKLVADLQDLMTLFDSLKLCKFIMFGGIKLTPILNWFNLVTGWNMAQEEFMRAGERISNLKRMFNVRLGVSRKDDWLPLRILTHRKGEGGAADGLPPLGRMLSEYYECRGWTPEGIPTKEKLLELGLHDAAEDL
mgnify:CR=1 FL=1